MRGIRRQDGGLSPNSETGDIPASGRQEEERPTVNRVVGRERPKARRRPFLLKNLSEKRQNDAERQETTVLGGPQGLEQGRLNPHF